MAINFPSTPSDQDTYTEGGITWRYIASKTAWLNSISGSVYVHTHVEADITDDGVVNYDDYNLFLRELSVQNGQ